MGRPMGMNLLKAGYSLTVWNRTAARADELVAAGAKLTKSPEELADNGGFRLTMVGDPAALEEVLWGPSGAMQALKRGSTYVDSSTISPILARKIAAACGERGVHFLDAPVTGGDWGAKKGELVFMIGGDAETLKEAEPILGVMGKKWFHLGPNGAGQTIKLAMNLILALQVDALAEALALTTRAGIQGEKLVEVMQSSMARSGAVRAKVKPFLAHHAENGLGLFQSLGIAANHENQLAFFGAPVTARNGRVQKMNTSLATPRGNIPGKDWRNRARVHISSAAL